MALRRENYWNEHYEAELKNFEEDGDEGEIWFGKLLSRKIVDRIAQEIQKANSSLPDERLNILDIGCGNSYLLCQVVDKIDPSKLACTGIDYSNNSIELSRKIIEARKLEDKIKLSQCDFLNSGQIESLIIDNKGRRFDILVDKGTFDAICLIASGSDADLNQVRVNYMKSLCSLANDNALFIFASCNHTEEELSELFKLATQEGIQRDTSVIGKIETPKFQFGGKEGSQVCCLVIKFNN